MAVSNLKNLVAKLNPICKRGLEGAAGLCMSRTNYNVEIEHWLLKLLEPDNTDLRRILRQYDADAGKVNRELVRALEATRTGNARAPELSAEVVDHAPCPAGYHAHTPDGRITSCAPRSWAARA